MALAGNRLGKEIDDGRSGIGLAIVRILHHVQAVLCALWDDDGTRVLETFDLRIVSAYNDLSLAFSLLIDVSLRFRFF